MAKKITANVATVTSSLEKRNRKLTKVLEREIQERNHDVHQRNIIHKTFLMMQAAIRDDKAQELCSAISFYVASPESVIWNDVDADDKKGYLNTIESETYAVVRKSNYSFLPPGTDICITIRESTESQEIEKVLLQIVKAMQMDSKITCCDELNDDPFGSNMKIINGILQTD